MRKLDRTTAKEIIAKLKRIPPDAQPRWGKMNRAQLYGHLALVMRHMLGDAPPIPYKGTWVSRHVFRHLVVNGLIEIPHNIRLPRPKGAPRDFEPPTCELADLERAMNDYIDALDQGRVPPAQHPFFGQLSNEEWRKFHIRHFKHHCKQFGVW